MRNLPLPPNIARSVERLFWIAPRVLATFLCSPTSISGATSTRLSTSPALAPSAASGPSGFCDSPTLGCGGASTRSEEHTSELQSLMRISYAVFCLKKKKKKNKYTNRYQQHQI